MTVMKRMKNNAPAHESTSPHHNKKKTKPKSNGRTLSPRNSQQLPRAPPCEGKTHKECPLEALLQPRPLWRKTLALADKGKQPKLNTFTPGRILMHWPQQVICGQPRNWSRISRQQFLNNRGLVNLRVKLDTREVEQIGSFHNSTTAFSPASSACQSSTASWSLEPSGIFPLARGHRTGRDMDSAPAQGPVLKAA